MVKYKEFELITVAYDEYEFHPSFASKMTSQLTYSGSKLLEEPLRTVYVPSLLTKIR